MDFSSYDWDQILTFRILKSFISKQTLAQNSSHFQFICRLLKQKIIMIKNKHKTAFYPIVIEIVCFKAVELHNYSAFYFKAINHSHHQGSSKHFKQMNLVIIIYLVMKRFRCPIEIVASHIEIIFGCFGIAKLGYFVITKLGCFVNQTK